MDSATVKKIRMEMRLTQRQFALKIGLKTQSPLSKIEDGFLRISTAVKNGMNCPLKIQHGSKNTKKNNQ